MTLLGTAPLLSLTDKSILSCSEVQISQIEHDSIRLKTEASMLSFS